MKKLMVLSIMLSMTINAYTQTLKKDSVYVLYEKDEMEDKTYYYPSGKKVAVIDNTRKMGVSISAFIDEEGDELVVKDLDVKSVGVGSCVENDELIMLFEDDNKIKLTSWNKFNCDGNSWFKLSKSDIEIFSTKKLKKIKFTNGRTYDSITGEIAEDKQSYFCELFYALKVKKIKQIKSK